MGKNNNRKTKQKINKSNLKKITKNKKDPSTRQITVATKLRNVEADIRLSNEPECDLEEVDLDQDRNWVPKVSAFTEPEFNVDGNYQEYTQADVRKRMKLLTNGAVEWRAREGYYQRLSREHLKFLKKLEKEMHGFWRIKYTDRDNHAKAFRLLAQHTFLSRYDDESKGVQAFINEKQKAVKSQTGLDKFLNYYIPSDSRILITRNITFNKDDVIPVFSDIRGENLENLTVPKTLTFDYTGVNIVNQAAEEKLAKAITMSQEKGNSIQCECCSSDLFVPCYENEQCPCYKMNIRMRFLQVEKSGCKPTEFATFKPSYFSHVRNKFYNYVGFACSDSCSCSGKCTNNSMMFIDKKMFPFEMFRRDWDYGFNVVSPVLIPAGTPVMEFTGEIVSQQNLNQENNDYCYTVSYHDDDKWRLLLAGAPFNDDYKQLIYDLSFNNFLIDPKKHGNIGRIVGHACIPNLEVVRIFRKSLSPAHMSLVLVSLEDIYPGTVLSFDYGREYAKTLEDCCKCGTFACRNNQSSNAYANLTCAEIAVAIKDIHEMKHEIFEDRVINPIRK